MNVRCRIRTCDGYRVVSVSGIPPAHYAVGDRLGVTGKAVRKSLRRLAWQAAPPVQRELAFPGADPGLPVSKAVSENLPVSLDTDPDDRLGSRRARIIERWENSALRFVSSGLTMNQDRGRRLLRRPLRPGYPLSQSRRGTLVRFPVRV